MPHEPKPNGGAWRSSGALPLRRYAPTPGFIALRPIRMNEKRREKERPLRKERPIRLWRPPGARVASQRCSILRADKEQNRRLMNPMQKSL